MSKFMTENSEKITNLYTKFESAIDNLKSVGYEAELKNGSPICLTLTKEDVTREYSFYHIATTYEAISLKGLFMTLVGKKPTVKEETDFHLLHSCGQYSYNIPLNTKRDIKALADYLQLDFPAHLRVGKQDPKDWFPAWKCDIARAQRNPKKNNALNF
jgi:hypothetical protein